MLLSLSSSRLKIGRPRECPSLCSTRSTWFAFLLLLAFVGSGGVASAQILLPSAVGRTEGDFSVSHFGAATYKFDVWTPPGVNGVQPDLAISYSSQSSGGLIGMGWSVTGLSQIARCQRTFAQDGYAQSVLLSMADAFCLDGERLRSTGGTYGQSGSTYQKEITDFTHVIAQGAMGNGPLWFEVKTKNGLIYEYGNSWDSRATLPGATTPHMWALSKVRDRVGNNMAISYTPANGTLVPAEIQYTQTGANSSYPYSIVFSYVGRSASATVSGFVAGAPYTVDSRLAAIQVKQGGSSGTILRTYRLGYDESPTTSRSRLSAVQECAGPNGTECKPATNISYQNGELGIAAPSLVEDPTLSSSVRTIFADINRDGSTDLLYGLPSGSAIRWYVRPSASNYLGAYSNAIDTGISVTSNDDVLVDDFTGSGQLTILAPANGEWRHYRLDILTSTFSSTSTGLAVDSNRLLAPNPADGRWPSFASADVNGDGLPDLVWGATYNGTSSVYTRLNTTTGGTLSFSSNMTAAYPIPASPHRFAGVFGNNSAPNPDLQDIDFNADGRDDVVMSTYTTTQIDIVGTARQLISQGTTFATGVSLPNGLGWPNALKWNDDSCTDFMTLRTIYVSACNGATGQSIFVDAPAALVDWDSDGRTDLLGPVGGELYVQRSLGTAVAAPVPTGIPYSSGTRFVPVDHDADGLTDLVSWDTSGTIRIGLHRGTRKTPDLVSEIADGMSNRVTFVYVNTKHMVRADESYPGVPAPTFPEAPFDAALDTVSTVNVYDSKGHGYTNIYNFYAPRRNLQGRGFSGFAARRRYDSRGPIYQFQEYRQDFPFVGAISAERVQRGSSASNPTGIIRSLTNTHTKHLWNLNLPTQRQFPYIIQSIARSYEIAGPFEGAEVLSKRTMTHYDYWGTLTTHAVTTTEGTTGLNPGATYSEIINWTDLLNDVDSWCFGRPGRTEYTNSHSLPGGSFIRRVKAQVWDLAGCRLQEETVEPGDAKWQVTTAVSYDTFGNVNSVTVTPAPNQGQAERTTTIDWGTSGQFPRVLTNAKSQVTRISWDEQHGVQSSSVDRNGLLTEWDHDAFGRVRLERRPDNTSTEYVIGACSAANSYCGSSDLRWSVEAILRDANNGVIRTHGQYYDSLDRLRLETQPGINGATISRFRTYDALSRLASESAPAMQSDPIWYTSYTYDLRNRVTQITRQASESDTSAKETRISYEGLRTIVTDALDRSGMKVRNALGDVIQSIDAAGNDTDFEYDPFGNLLKTRDVFGNESSATYNVRGMRMSSNDPDRGAWTYDYFPLGELKSQTTARNQTSSFTHDVLSRPLTRVEPEGTTTWTWDTAARGVGQLSSVQSPGGAAGSPYSETFTYDALGRPSQKSVVVDGTTYLLNYAYNPASGALEALTYPTSTSGVRFKLRYDYQYGLLQSIRNYTGNTLGTVFWQANASNARGQFIDEQLGNGLRTISSYDRITGSLESRTSGPSASSTRQNLEYEWDKLGRLTTRRELNLNLSETFFYDSLDRLDYSQLNGVTNLDVAYDAIGNITQKSDVGTYTYHPVKRHAVVSAGSRTFTYDANGNMLTRNGASINWASFDLPTVINQADGAYSQFWYGADRSRYKQVSYSASWGTDTTVYVGNNIYERVTRNTGVIEHKHYIQAPTGLVALYNRKSSGTNETVYLLNDHVGSPTMITNSSGTQMARLSETAFGKRRAGGSWTGNNTQQTRTATENTTRRGFTGHEVLDNLDLIHMNGRVYDPVVGRFLSADPFVQEPYHSQSLNRYSYALNNPLNYTDPSGYFWDDFDDWFDFDWWDDLGWEDWFNDNDEPQWSCEPAGSELCRRFGLYVMATQYCGWKNSECIKAVMALYYPTRPPAEPTPTPDPTDELPPLPDPEPPKVPVPGPADGVPGLGGGSAYGGAVAARVQSSIESIPGYRHAADFANYWAELAEHSWNAENWLPGDGSVEALLAGLPPVIGMPAHRLAHVMARHTIGGARTAGKSLFDEAQDVVSLIQNAAIVPRVRQAGGNFERVVDAGRIIGVDRVTGQPTSIYTVITNASDELITAFPGRP